MKKYIVGALCGVLSLGVVALGAHPAFATPSDADQLIALGMNPAIARKLVQVVNTLASPFTNNTYVTFRNAGNSANISVLKVDGTDDTVLNADTGDVIKLAVAGSTVTTVDSSGISTSGELIANTSGKTVALQEATSGSKCMGSGTHNGTTAVTVSTSCATTGSRIFLTETSDPTGSTAAQCWVTNLQNGTSFDVDCDQANDATFNWIIFHEAA